MMPTTSRCLHAGLVLALCAGALSLPQPVPLDAQAAPRTTRESGGLSSGAIRVGDRIILMVEDEEALTDTFTVKAGTYIDLPVLGEVQLAGVRRSDVESHLTREIGRFIKNPLVRAYTLVRIAVLGEVGTSGYFAVPSDALLADVINEAGGPTAEADMKKVQLQRRGKVLRKGSQLRNEIAAGQTIDELGLEAGDEIIIPRRHDSERMVRILSLIVAIPLTVVALGRM